MDKASEIIDRHLMINKKEPSSDYWKTRLVDNADMREIKRDMTNHEND